MKIYNYNQTGVYIGSSEADESPLEPGVFLIPAYATDIAPPPMQDGQLLKFDGETWGYVPFAKPEVEPTKTPEEQPITVPMWQARAALRRSHLLDQADAAVNASGNGDLMEYWQYATTLDEGNDFTKLFATTIGLTDKQMHDLFVTAAAIKL